MNFVKMSEWWAKNSFNCPVVIGHGLYKFGNPAEGDIFMDPMQLETQFFYARRQENIQGSFLFNATAFTENKIDILSNLKKIYAEKTLIPFMGRETAPKPQTVAQIDVAGKTMSWQSQGNDMRYVIYKIIDKNATIVDIVSTNEFTCNESGLYVASALNSDNSKGEISEPITIQ